MQLTASEIVFPFWICEPRMKNLWIKILCLAAQCIFRRCGVLEVSQLLHLACVSIPDGKVSSTSNTGWVFYFPLEKTVSWNFLWEHSDFWRKCCQEALLGMTVKATVKYIHLCKTPLLSSESGNSADLERMLGLPCPRDFNRWRFSLWYRVKPIAKILANSSQCNSGFVLFFFLSSFLPLDVFCSCCLLPLLSHACCLLPSPSLLLTSHCMLPVHRPILNIIPNYKFMFPPLDKIYQTALKYCINFCFKSSPVIQYSAVYNLFNLTELFSINSLLSFSHHCPPCNLGELQTFSPSQSHISLCFYSIMIH